MSDNRMDSSRDSKDDPFPIESHPLGDSVLIPSQMTQDGHRHPNKPLYDPCYDLRQRVQRCFKESESPLRECWDFIDPYQQCENERMSAINDFQDTVDPRMSKIESLSNPKVRPWTFSNPDK